MSESKGLQINWLGASGSALGAVTSAVLLSTLGAAGTLIGAALGSLIITVGGAVYSYSLERAKSGLEKTAEKVKYSGRGNRTAAENNAPSSATSERRNMEDPTQTASMQATGEEPEATEKPRWQQTLRGLPPRFHRSLRFFSGSLRSEEHTSELQSRFDIVCRLLLE